MSFTQPPLPYALNALAPFLSQEQMDYHYNKHHAAYFAKLNTLVEARPEANKSLEELIRSSEGGIFNNAAQCYNHTFFWNGLKAGGGGLVNGTLKSAIDRDFGSFEAFKTAFSTAGLNLFGSGWVWLVKDASGKLEILPLSNADNPLRYGKKPLLTLDVWEHAYYVDYRNARPKFIEAFWSSLNWDFVQNNFSA